jgi:YD repeat-containing protein
MTTSAKPSSQVVAREASRAISCHRLSSFVPVCRRQIYTGCFAVLLALPLSHAHAGSVSYTYDALGRIATVVFSNGTSIVSYNYDATGNWTLVTTATP